MEDKTILYFIVVLIIGLILYQYYGNNDNNKNNSCQVCPVCPTCQQNQQSQQSQQSNQHDTTGSETIIIQQPTPNINVEIIPDPNVPPPNPLREYDYRALRDPLVPPRKRDDYNIPVIPFPTRGYPSGYKKMGLLIDPDADNDNKYKFLILVGRQRYPGSTVYDYFVTENKPDSALKFDLPNLHKELYTDDEITIDELGKTFKLKLDRTLGFEYDPFMY